MRIVLDTNVLVSGLIVSHAPPGRIVDLLRVGALRLVVDDRIMAEYADVLRRHRLRRYFSAEDAEAMIDFLLHDSDHRSADAVVTDLPDLGDAPFLEVALSAGADLVKGNLRHFPEDRRRGCTVLSPSEFLARWSELPTSGPAPPGTGSPPGRPG